MEGLDVTCHINYVYDKSINQSNITSVGHTVEKLCYRPLDSGVILMYVGLPKEQWQYLVEIIIKT